MRAPANPRAALLAVVLVLVTAFLLKLHYSRADDAALAWVLAPTASVVELVTGADFESEPGRGYVSPDLGIAIASSCAGVNFLIASFAMLGLAWGWRSRTVGEALRTTVLALAIAYVATVLANAVRIVVAMYVAHGADPGDVADGDATHRLVGIVVYFTSLCLLYALLVLRRLPASADGRPRTRLWLVPLACYLGITIAVPVLNGWLRGRPMPWDGHALVVVLVPAAILLLFALGDRYRNRRPPSPPPPPSASPPARTDGGGARGGDG